MIVPIEPSEKLGRIDLEHLSVDDEIADLTMCTGMFLGLGRMLAVLGVRAPDERILV